LSPRQGPMLRMCCNCTQCSCVSNAPVAMNSVVWVLLQQASHAGVVTKTNNIYVGISAPTFGGC
jgi:hypothetical protein